MPNFRMNARGRPHSLQRLFCRVENFGFFAALANLAFVAISPFHLPIFYCARNGMPKCFSSERAWLSLLAVVTMVTFMPFNLSTFA